MAKITEKIKEKLSEKILPITEIDSIMEKEGYIPAETDEETEEGTLRYSNGKSEMWVKYYYHNGEYLIKDVTLKTKKSGSTKTRHLTTEEILAFMRYFEENGKINEYMTFMLELLFARRIGDTLSLDWEHFYYENGKKRDTLRVTEDKTDKIANVHITETAWKYVEKFCTWKNINPTENIKEDVILGKYKNGITKYMPDGKTLTDDYKKAVEKQESAFRYQFTEAAKKLGIYGVSTHSIRKTFGNIAHKINQFDPDCIDVLQSVYVHENRETTKIYIDVIDEKARKMYSDVAEYVHNAENGSEPTIDNIPVIALKTNDLRNLLLKAYAMGMENINTNAVNHMEKMNTLILETEKIRVQ